jgi:hypothetical protein
MFWVIKDKEFKYKLQILLRVFIAGFLLFLTGLYKILNKGTHFYKNRVLYKNLFLGTPFGFA